jgi:glucosamine-6-phosphate deaminase
MQEIQMPPKAPQPVQSFTVDRLPVRVYASQTDLAGAVAVEAHETLINTLDVQGSAAVILATGNSQIRFLDQLLKLGGIDWSRITLFHMDEYLGIDAAHKGSFRHYMREKVLSRITPKAFHFIEGDCDEPLDEIARYAGLLKAQSIDLCCLGIGENGHIAFNDPHVADFDDPHWVKLVKLDDVCKQQQAKEGHFASAAAVNPYAFTLTVTALCSSKRMLCLAPEKRKSGPVRDMLRGPVSETCPASVLRRMPQCTLFLDKDSAALL